jgi:hypothetical protein
MSIVAIAGEILYSTAIPPEFPACSNEPVPLQTLKNSKNAGNFAT